MCSTLRELVRCVLGTAVALAVPAAAQTSAAWQSWLANPDGHPNIPNVSHAGFSGGGVALPDGADALVISVSDFGAVGDGIADDTAAVRAAIAEAGSRNFEQPGGSVVFFPPGEYRLTGPLLIHHDRVQLRGAERSNTLLTFDGSLTSTFAVYPGDDPGDSNWSFNGGMIWFTHASRLDYMPGVPTINTTNNGFRLSSTRDIVQPAFLGDRTITVSNAAGYTPGATIVIEIDNAADFSTLRHLLGDGIWAQNYIFTSARDGSITPDSRSSFRVYHIIESVNGNQITLREPLRFDCRPEWDPEIRFPSDLRRRVGVADITIQFNRDYEWLRSVHHNREVGFNGIAFTDTIDGFVDRVTVIDCDGLAVFMNYAKNVTVQDLVVDASGPERLLHHHAVGFANSADCLVQDFEIRSKPLHGIYVGNFCVGNVYSRGLMHHGTFDYHKRLPYSNVFTEITVTNTGDSGGAATSGPQMAARHVHWNIDLRRTSSRLIAQPDIMPMGALVGVQCATPTSSVDDQNGDTQAIVENVGLTATSPNPPNLYEAQLAHRLSQAVPSRSPEVPCAGCFQNTVYSFDFAGVTGEAITGQDNWIFSRDFSSIDGINTLLETVTDHPDGPLHAAVNVNGRDSVITRQNDHRFAFTPFSATDTDARIRFDARSGLNGSSSGNVYLILNNSDGRDEGIQFGMTQGQFQIRGGQFSGVLQQIVSVPSGWYTRGEWARLELRIDFTANGGEGAASLYFMNLSDGDTTFRAIPGLQNVPFQGEVEYPETWDRIGFRIRNTSAATNLVANVEATATACCDADWSGDGALDLTEDLFAFVMLHEAGSASTDIDEDGMLTIFDIIEFIARFEEGCP